LAWYERHADSYATRTLEGGPEADRDAFVDEVGLGARVLDVGCGAGRDLRAFADAGLQPEGLEASPTLAAWARRHAGVKVTVGLLEDAVWDAPFDGVWACASLVHVPCSALRRPLDRIASWLKPGGTLWFSMRCADAGDGAPGDRGPDERGRYACSERTLQQALRGAERLEVGRVEVQRDHAPGVVDEVRANWWAVWATRR
jgi:SAM-dependent methyltransferase